jgi:hypothetical protein
VYVLRDKLGKILRTGRAKDLIARARQHDREFPGLLFETIFGTDSPHERRGLAHLLHEMNKPILDKIREISPNNPNKPKYIRAAIAYLRKEIKDNPDNPELREKLKSMIDFLKKDPNGKP